MLAVYIVALGVSSLLVGAFSRQVVTLLGFVPSEPAAWYVLLTGASANAALQLFFLALMRLYQPTRDRATLATEAVSHAAAIVFIPYLLHMPLPSSSTTLQRAEPLIYLAAFLGLHAFIKLATFYASLQGPPARRLPLLGWVAAGGLCCAMAYLGVSNWAKEIERTRRVVYGEARYQRAGDQIALARSIEEGAALAAPMAAFDGQSLALRVANLPAAPPEARHTRAYLTITLTGAETKVYETSVRLPEKGWAQARVPSRSIPRDLRAVEVRWTRKTEPNWQRLLGLRPIVYNLPDAPGGRVPPPARILLSGPVVYRERPPGQGLNFLVLLVDGLGANHVSMLGYAREVTPSIDRLGYGGVAFPNAFAATEDPVAAIRSLLTGLDARHPGATPRESVVELLRGMHYATAAFSEAGDATDEDLIGSAGLAHGFEIFDVHNPNAVQIPGSSATLEKARQWISDHEDVSFFCLVRMRELEDPRPLQRYTAVYREKQGPQRDVDVFDNGLLYLDRQIGALMKYIRDHELAGTTCIILTSPYGHDFSLGPSGRRLAMPSGRVPLIIHVPAGRNRRRPERATLADVAPTIAALAGAGFTTPVDGRDILKR